MPWGERGRRMLRRIRACRLRKQIDNADRTMNDCSDHELSLLWMTEILEGQASRLIEARTVGAHDMARRLSEGIMGS